MSKEIDRWFDEYDAFHRTKGNKISHILGIPLIVMSFLGLLDKITLLQMPDSPARLTPALILWAFANTFYLMQDLVLGLSLLISTAILYWCGTQLPTWALWVLFVAGWVAQGVGHYVYEKQSPAFLQNFRHLLIGPAYIQNHFLRIRKHD